jgi:hypothetical protein
MNSTPAIQTPAVPVVADGPIGKAIDQATASLIARVNAVPLTAEELMLASAEIQKLPLDSRDREARTQCLVEMFNGQRGKASVVNLRLAAMAQLIRAERIPSWWVRPNMARASVFSTAATEPLLLNANNDWFFEPESFVTFLLETAEDDGHA